LKRNYELRITNYELREAVLGHSGSRASVNVLLEESPRCPHSPSLGVCGVCHSVAPYSNQLI
ncbi:MAG: hypothetical protein ACYTXY_42525, partial [Nostoc sp.]